MATLLVLVALVGVALSWIQPTRLDRRYFPMAVGDRWVYAAESDGQPPGEVTFEVVGRADVGRCDCFEVRRTGLGGPEHFFVSVTNQGAWIYRVGKHDYAPPFRQFAFSTLPGHKWQWKGTAAAHDLEVRSQNMGRETVATPLGVFKVFRVREELIGSSQPTVINGWTDYWLAKGVGVVRLSGKQGDIHNPTHEPFDWRLKEFTHDAR